MRRADPISVDLQRALRIALAERIDAMNDEEPFRDRGLISRSLAAEALLDALRDELRRHGLNADTSPADDAPARTGNPVARLDDGASVTTQARNK